MKPLKISSQALLLAAASAMPFAASAQEVAGNADDENTDNRIVVTGSRIATDATTALASPVQVVTAEEFRDSGEVDITEALRDIPALQGALPATLDSADGGDVTGASTLNLRQLGTARTLVLQDGRRHVPGFAGTATVDVSSIPQALIGSVEVLTGGASAIYGADAVSGVVNFKTRTGRDFDGIEYRAQTGISDEGDAEDYFVSVAGGGEFSDGRGSAVFALEYSHSTSITNGDRPDIAGPGFSSFNGSNDAANAFLGLAPGTRNAFFPNRTLPVSSPGSTIGLAPGSFNVPFFALLDTLDATATPGTFDPSVDTVPNIPGTNIPVLQIIDPVTGELRAFNPGFATGAFNAIGGDGIAIGETALGQTLIPEITRVVAAAGVDYEITEGITFFADAKFAYAESSSINGIPFSDDIPIALDNPFLPQALVDQIPIVDALSDETPTIFVARDNLGSETNSGSAVERSTIRATGGFRGDITDTVKFEVSYAWGRTEVDSIDVGSRLNDRYYTALDAVALTQADIDAGVGNLNAIRGGQDIQIDGSSAQVGDIVCRAELTGERSPAALFVGAPPLDEDGLTRPVTFQIGDGRCAPLNILGSQAIQGAGRDFAFVDLTDRTVIEQQQFLAVVSGDTSNFFELPGGPIGFATGFEYRRDTSNFVPDSFKRIEGNVVGNTAAIIDISPTDGQGISVKEGFGELRFPLLEGLPGIEYLEVTASGRYSDYNTIGTTKTYSFGGTYKPVDWFTLRGTYSRAIRAPNIGELFAPQGPAFIGVDEDPCDDDNVNDGTTNRQANCLNFVADGFDSSDFLTAFVTGTTGGNPNLIEETSDSFTIGGIFAPRGILGGALDNLVVIADYYDIEITDAIGTLSGADIAEACVDLPSIDNQFCDNIQRDPNNGGAISGFTSGNINLSSLRARGVDFEARYTFDAPFGDGDYGTFRLSATGTYFLERSTESDPIIQQTIESEEDPLQQQLLIADQGLNSDLLNVIGVPDLIINFGINWDLDRLSIGWNGRYVDSSLQRSNSASFVAAIEGDSVTVTQNEGLLDLSQFKTGSALEHNINVSYDVTDDIQLYGGVNNLTDRKPFLGSLVRPVGPRGRFFFVGVSGSF